MTNSVGDDSRHSPGSDGPAEEADVVPERQPGVRNQTLNQLIFLKRRLMIGFISDKHDTDVGRWWMTVGEGEETESDGHTFGDYLRDEVTADDVKEILESYEGCAGKRKAYDYLNTLRALEPSGREQ